MRAWIIGTTFMFLLSSGCSDTIAPLQQTKSPNGDVDADYVKIMYGGAAGGVTYCVNLAYGDKEEECAIAGIHIETGNLKWDDRRLIFEYCGGTITNNESGTRRSGEAAPFVLSIAQTCPER